MILTDLDPEIQQELIEMQGLAGLGPEDGAASLDLMSDGSVLTILRGIKLWMQMQRDIQLQQRLRSGGRR